MEKLNYVERRPDPTDQRRIEVRPAADLELLIRVLRETEELQEAHTERVRARC